jgi:hypothetical protein
LTADIFAVLVPSQWGSQVEAVTATRER